VEVRVPAQQFVGGVQPQGFVEVDAARLLLLLDRFATAPDDETRGLACAARVTFERHFASEYYLQKLDFLLRYPRYFAFEVIELHAAADGPAVNRTEAMATVRSALAEGEPELNTEPITKFWRGAYERRDQVEAWWFCRALVFVGRERRGDSPGWKHYFLTAKGAEVARRLRSVEEVGWYVRRIDEIHRFLGHLRPSQLKERQYRYQPYRDARLNQPIPDLSARDVEENFRQTFNEPLGVPLG